MKIKTKVAWIGTGVMGQPMATHLAEAGYQVSAYNRTYEKAHILEPLVKAHKDIKSCVQDADIIFSIVGYPKDVKEVYDEVMTYAKKGAILVDMTTSSPTLAKELAQKAMDLGYAILDAPVTGGDIGAKHQTLSIMVGGDEQTFKTILPLLKHLGTTITYMGPSGSGQHAKLSNQIAIAGAISGVAEALVYAKDKDLDLSRMLQVITGGSASSWQAIHNGPKMMIKDYAPGFYIKHFLKDLKLALEEKKDLPLVVLEKVTSLYEQLSHLEMDDLGTQALIEYYLQKTI